MIENDFICYLRCLNREDTGTLAEFRRACGERWASRAPQLAQFGESRTWLASDFLALGLAAQFKSDTIRMSGLPSNKEPKKRVYWPFEKEGNVGAAWAAYCKKRKAEDNPQTFYEKRQSDLANGHSPANVPSIHERFRTLLDAELELDGTGELAYRLRGLVRMLVAEDIPIDVLQLAHDLRGWRTESRYVQEQWAKAFYAPPPYGSQTASSSSGDDEPMEDTGLVDHEEDKDDVD